MTQPSTDPSLYRAFFKNSNSVMLIVDPSDGTIIDCNTKAELFYGYDTESLCRTGMGVLDVDFNAETYAQILNRTCGDDPCQLLSRHRLASGLERDVEIHATLFQWKGRITLFAVIHDITDQRRAERQRDVALKLAQSATRAKTEFLSSMSHELRTPLNAIIGFSELIKEELLGTVGVPAYRDYATSIFESGHNLLSLISDILDYADLKAGRTTGDDADVDVATEIAVALAPFQRWIEARGHTLVINVPSDLPRLIADPDGLGQMLSNLVSNAIKYTPVPGTVGIRAWTDDTNAIRIAVSDTGIGIPSHLHKAVFHAFEHTTDAGVRNFQGSGIGLALVKSLMDVHGGRILLDSRPGQGTTLTLVFAPERTLSLVRPRS